MRIPTDPFTLVEVCVACLAALLLGIVIGVRIDNQRYIATIRPEHVAIQNPALCEFTVGPFPDYERATIVGHLIKLFDNDRETTRWKWAIDYTPEGRVKTGVNITYGFYSEQSTIRDDCRRVKDYAWRLVEPEIEAKAREMDIK